MNNKTSWKSVATVSRKWFIVDAAGMPLGRLAATIAKYLMGKNEVDYSSNLDMGNSVIVLNASAVKFTGKKRKYLELMHYTGYPSGLKREKVDVVMEKNPAKVIHSAVKGMLPDTKLKDAYLSRMQIYKDATHPHEAQKPTKITVAE